VRKIQTQILSIVTVMLIGITMFSMANATTPEENQAAGVAFLAENAKKPNIKTTASGLQYEVLTQGTGKVSPAATDTVTVHYKGTTLDGTEFDSSYSRGAPASFPLNRVIAGWTEGVQLMKEGDKFRFYIPADLAYGSEGAGRLIGPNAALIFEVELIKIQ
jgi:FKBP-type peptidyl-prolyl cis-trans isomerase